MSEPRSVATPPAAVADAGPVPVVVVEIVLVAAGGVGETEVVESEVGEDAPPGVPVYAQRVQHLPEVQAELAAYLPFVQVGRRVRVPLGAIGHGKIQEAERAGLEAETPCDSAELQIPGVDLVRVVPAVALLGRVRRHVTRQAPDAEADQILGIGKGEYGRRARTEKVHHEILVRKAVHIGTVPDFHDQSRERRQSEAGKPRGLWGEPDVLVKGGELTCDDLERNEMRGFVGPAGVGSLAEPLFIREMEPTRRVIA